MMLKDLLLAGEAADAAGLDLPLGGAATDTYEAFVKAGQGGLDFSAIVNYIRGDVEPSP